nr:hypothetical protein [Chitinophagaceae bacterium]
NVKRENHMAQAKTASKNDPSTRGAKAAKRKYKGKDVNPVLYVGETRRYMAAAYDSGELVGVATILTMVRRSAD